MYGKIFESTFDSTLVHEGGWLPTYIFMCMIAIADKDGCVKTSPKALFRRAGFREYDNKIGYSDFEKAIKYLTEEDPESNSKAYNGKRIIPLEELSEFDDNRGWWIVNYQKYREKGSSTERVRKYRDSKKNNNLKNGVTLSTLQSVTETHTDTDTDTDTDKRKRGRFTPPSLAEVKDYVNEKQYSVNPNDFLNFYESKDWMVGKNKMKSWQAAIRTWESRNKKESQEDYTKDLI